MKTCSKCNLEKPIIDYYKSNPYVCKPCHKASIIARKKSDPNKAKSIDRKYRLKKVFGISQEQYESMVIEQNNTCAICHNPETKIDYRSNKPYLLAVDHCHTTGAVRGLLCSSCNTALGHLKDDIKVLQSAIEYLKKSPQY